MDGAYLGKRAAEIRVWRGLGLKAVADLSGLSVSYISMIENGKRPVNKRQVLDALAGALRVSPHDLQHQPWEWQAPNAGARSHPNLVALEAAMDAYELGDDPGSPTRSWPVVAAEVRRLVDLMQLQADYETQAVLVPQLLGELHSLYVRKPRHRREILLALVRVYSSATWVAKLLGSGGLTLMASMRAQHCAQALESPQWCGYTTWLRGVTTGGLDRHRQYQRAIAMARDLEPAMSDPEVKQAAGQLHLSAALAAAAQSDRDLAMTHLDEAEGIANLLDAPVNSFAQVWFGTVNVGIWRVTVGLELGEGTKAALAARDLPVRSIPSPARQAVAYAGIGRGLLAQKRRRPEGVNLILKAEELAPQHIRGDVFLREEIVGILRRKPMPDAVGIELRALLHRMRTASAA